MASANKVKLDVNVPLVGTVKFIDHYDEKPNPNKPGTVMSAQWGLTGAWQWTDPDGTNREAEGRVYIDTYQLAASPVALGLAEQSGQWDDGRPRYKWTHTGPVRLVKTQKDRKNTVTISRLDGNGHVIASPTATVAAPPPPAASPRVPQPSGQLAAGVKTGATTVPVPHTQDGEWAKLADTYKRAADIALAAWKGVKLGDDAIVAAAATVFIEANKRGLAVATADPRKMGAAIRDQLDKFAEMPAALRGDAEEPPLDEPPPWALG